MAGQGVVEAAAGDAGQRTSTGPAGLCPSPRCGHETPGLHEVRRSWPYRAQATWPYDFHNAENESQNPVMKMEFTV